MKKVEELYPQEDYGLDCFCCYDYNPMLKEFGDILIQVDDDDWQGDSRVLYEKDGKLGYLLFGWGSCSGCDSLQACENYKELQEHMDWLNNSIQWFDSNEDCLRFFKEHDWEGDYCSHVEEQKEFIEKVIGYLTHGL